MHYRGLELDAFQQRAIAALDAGRSVLVSAPTGTGKTIIADWIVDEALSAGKSVVYTAPIKALSNQKFRDYTRLHGEAKVGLVTGDLVIRRDAPCLVMTTEILRNILLAREPVDHLRAVILDEIHFLDDRERGTTWEEVLIYLPRHVQIVGLSATLSNLTDFAEWLSHVRGSPVDVVREDRRAVPLRFYCFSGRTGLLDPSAFDARFRKESGRHGGDPGRGRGRGRGRDRGHGRGRRTSHVDVFDAMERADLLPYLYFVFSRRDTEAHARGLARNLRAGLLDVEERQRLEARLERASSVVGAALDGDLRALYERGIAFHHAGLHVQLKALVEELYEQRLIKVLYCTSTFALGINMPARSVVFDGIKKYDGRSVAPLTTRGFMQKAGRAGRRGMDQVGHVVVRVDFEEYGELAPILDRYRKGAYEPVRSSFNLSWNSVVNLLAQHSPGEIREILDSSFLAWHLSRQAEARLNEARDQGDGNRERKLRKRAEQADNHCWNEFSVKVDYLRSIGYLGDDDAFHAGARVLRNVQIAEIAVCELVLDGVLESLGPARLFGVLAGLTNELPRHCERNFRIRQEDRGLARQVESIVHGRVVLGAEALTHTTTAFDTDLLHLGTAWAEGTSLDEIMLMIRSDTDVSGDLVTGFRRAKDLAVQLVDVYRDTDAARASEIRELVHAVARDEVEVVD